MTQLLDSLTCLPDAGRSTDDEGQTLGPPIRRRPAGRACCSRKMERMAPHPRSARPARQNRSAVKRAGGRAESAAIPVAFTSIARDPAVAPAMLFVRSRGITPVGGVYRWHPTTRAERPVGNMGLRHVWELGRSADAVSHAGTCSSDRSISSGRTAPSVARSIFTAKGREGCRWRYAIFRIVEIASPIRSAKSSTLSPVDLR